MRRESKPILLQLFRDNPNLWMVSPDLGYKFLDDLKLEFSERVIIMGASEQCAVGIACGLALSGKIPIVYSITPFIVSRAHEWLKNHVNHDNIPIKILTGGRNDDYSAHDGFSHECYSDVHILSDMINIKAFWPKSIDELPETFNKWINHDGPAYLNLKR